MAWHRWERNLFGGAAVLAVILAIVFVLPAVDRAMPAERAAAAQRHTVADGISVIPPAGSSIAKRPRPGAGTGSMLFLVGPARYAISVEPFNGNVATASERLRTKIQSMRGYQVTGPEHPVVTGSGLSGLGTEFTAPGRSGRYVAFVVPKRAVEVTVYVSENDFQQALQPIDQSIASIAWSGGP